MITPTVGRVLWYYESGSREGQPPLPAIVTAVWGPRCVNVAVFAQNGVPLSHPPTSVQLLQDDDAPPRQTDGSLGRHLRWMPYQVQRAKEDNQAGRGDQASGGG